MLSWCRAGQPADGMRLFVALSLPDDVRAELGDALAAVRDEAPATVRWPPPER